MPATVTQTYAHDLPCAAQSGRRDALREETADYHAHGYKFTTYVNACLHAASRRRLRRRRGQRLLRQNAFGNTRPVPSLAFTDSSIAAPLHEIPLFVRAGATIPLLPAATGTLTSIGTVPGLVDPDEVRDRQRGLHFGADCGA